MVHIKHSMDPTIKISNPCKDSLDTWAKKFCIKPTYRGTEATFK